MRFHSIYNPLATQTDFQQPEHQNAPFESEGENTPACYYQQSDKYSMRIGSLFDSDDEESTFYNK